MFLYWEKFERNNSDFDFRENCKMQKAFTVYSTRRVDLRRLALYCIMTRQIRYISCFASALQTTDIGISSFSHE